MADPIQLSTQRPGTTPAPLPASRWPALSHSLAVVLGAALAVAGPIIVQQWPQAAPVVDAVKQALPEQPREPAEPYRDKLRAAWAAETDQQKQEQLRRLRFLYHAVVAQTETGAWDDLAQLSKSFHDGEASLGLAGQLPVLRGAVTAEWNARITAKSPAPITPLLRVEIAALLRQTLHALP